MRRATRRTSGAGSFAALCLILSPSHHALLRSSVRGIALRRVYSATLCAVSTARRSAPCLQRDALRRVYLATLCAVSTARRSAPCLPRDALRRVYRATLCAVSTSRRQRQVQVQLQRQVPQPTSRESLRATCQGHTPQPSHSGLREWDHRTHSTGKSFSWQGNAASGHRRNRAPRSTTTFYLSRVASGPRK
jgi:hypothetical protein